MKTFSFRKNLRMLGAKANSTQFVKDYPWNVELFVGTKNYGSTYSISIYKKKENFRDLLVYCGICGPVSGHNNGKWCSNY